MDFGLRVVLRADEVLTGLSLLVVPPIGDHRGEVAGLEAVLYGGQLHCIAHLIQMGWLFVLQVTHELPV